jgi:1,2-diacylglycerol 3-beta-galactosyltransferase
MQERYNAEWVSELGAGLVVPDFRRVDEAAARLLEPGAFTRFRERAAAVDNRAVFEIPGILASILDRHDLR